MVGTCTLSASVAAVGVDPLRPSGGSLLRGGRCVDGRAAAVRAKSVPAAVRRQFIFSGRRIFGGSSPNTGRRRLRRTVTCGIDRGMLLAPGARHSHSRRCCHFLPCSFLVRPLSVSSVRARSILSVWLSSAPGGPFVSASLLGGSSLTALTTQRKAAGNRFDLPGQ